MLNGAYCVTNPWNNLSPTEFVLYEEAVENIYNQLRNKTMPYDMLSEYKEKYKLIEKAGHIEFIPMKITGKLLFVII